MQKELLDKIRAFQYPDEVESVIAFLETLKERGEDVNVELAFARKRLNEIANENEEEAHDER